MILEERQKAYKEGLLDGKIRILKTLGDSIEDSKEGLISKAVIDGLLEFVISEKEHHNAINQKL